MSKVKLESIKALTFYQGENTKARRSQPIPQLTCVGKPCRLYQPEVVRCINLGGRGTDVDWRCEADLPERLRFGRVQVSCEGWSAPGDSYVLSSRRLQPLLDVDCTHIFEDSCGLEYRLVEVPRALHETDSHFPRSALNSVDWPTVLFAIPWFAALLWILYGLCWRRDDANNRSPRRRRGPGPGFSSSNWFPGGYDDDRNDRNDPPPPYSANKHGTAAQGWRPGFWTGAMVGGLADRFIFNNNNRRDRDHTETRPTRRMWDWERPATSARPAQPATGWRSWSSGADDRGEGTSDLGTMRRSSGLGGSTVR
ncbi:hypothetical protein V5O48_007222 [Marasmius crinis-equi]|uniref:Store-operated calcium entry-associated regulatory factor n=1 Tax=Marasmius crinis-equi TaxID=585013 RepID=A0ABR3FHA9_9AGAR